MAEEDPTKTDTGLADTTTPNVVEVTGKLSDEERINRVVSSLRNWQRGAFLCLFFCVVVLGASIFMFLGGGSVTANTELIPLELLPANRMNALSAARKEKRKQSREASKDLEALLVTDKAQAAVSDAKKIVQLMIDSENRFLTSIIEYGQAMESVTLSIGGANEWNYGFQKSLIAYEELSRSRVSELKAKLEEFPVWDSD
ncbi:MAG: hypothetical protein K6L75_08015 [Cellvibrionaceae bacterium]